ncbi:MAG: TonB-dependent receptor [Putridiphycobacter sp.]
MNQFFTTLLFLISFSVFGQNLTQTIRGTIRDKDTYEQLIGVKIVVQNSDPPIMGITDINGEFRLKNVPVGKQTLIITYLGYETVVLANIDVNSKEVVLNIGLEESVKMMNEVVVTGKEKGEVQNEMSTVSSRSFSIDESKRYAGSLNDVSRMAQNYAGVQGGNDSRNDIIVRGNSPTGVLYRLEGIDIPNPNHFAKFGTTGGPISMLNNNVLSNSDFMTSAFPAEYGNATAAVFDLKMRTGNNEKHEFLFQFGFNGAELMAEGPISKKRKSSYLVNYRYNNLILFEKLGINIGTSATPQYQDISFKLNFPNKRGVTSIFGIAGVSNIKILAEDVHDGDLYSISNSNTFFKSIVGVVGVNHKQRIGKSSFFNISTSYQTGQNHISNDTVDQNFENPFLTYFSKSAINKMGNRFYINKKFSSKHLLKFGAQYDIYFLNLQDSSFIRALQTYRVNHDYTGSTSLIQPFAQYQYKASPTLTFNLGIHYQYLSLNGQQSLEPRAGIAWQMSEKDRLSFGYGLHSQMLPMELYFREHVDTVNNTLVISHPSEDLDFYKSHHLVLGYSHSFKHGISLKTEAYFQYLFSVPVSENTNSTYSLSNFGAAFVEYFPMYMTNNGTGNNYGIDLTLEKFLDKGFYFLISSSLYESFYTPANDITYNSAFNGNYTFNALSGYELKFKAGKKYQTSLLFDLKFTRNGGKRYTPILLEESIASNQEIRDYSRAFELKYPDYTKGDIRVAYKIVGKNVTMEWAAMIQNFTNHKNIFLQEYDIENKKITTTYQTGILPIGQFKMYF